MKKSVKSTVKLERESTVKSKRESTIKSERESTIKLQVLERMVLDKTLPQVGSYDLLKEIQSLKSRLSFSEEERQKLNFKGVYRCKSCNTSNIELIENQVERWNRGIDKKPEEEEANKQLNEIMNFKVCPECHVEMLFTGQVVWQKVETGKGKLEALEKEIEIKPSLKILISETLKNLDKKGNLSEDQISLFEKFVNSKRGKFNSSGKES